MKVNKPKHTHKNSVRIIGGQFKRRTLNFIDQDGLRPTPDRLRETLFNWLTGDLQGASVLDVCAGSGVLGFESLSRGAKYAVLIELNKQQAHKLTINAQTLKADNITIIQGDCLTLLPKFDTPFDIVFVDPPYQANLWQAILNCLTQHKLIHAQTWLYIESNQTLDDKLGEQNLMIYKSTKVGQIYAYLVKLS